MCDDIKEGSVIRILQGGKEIVAKVTSVSTVHHGIGHPAHQIPKTPSQEKIMVIHTNSERQKLIEMDYEDFELRQFIDPDMFSRFLMPDITPNRTNWVNPNRKPRKSFKTKAYRRACY